MKKKYKIFLITAVAAVTIGGIVAYNPKEPQTERLVLKIAPSESIEYFWEDSRYYEPPPQETSQVASVWQEDINRHNEEVHRINQQAQRQQEIASIEQDLQRIKCCQQKAKTLREKQCLQAQQDRIIEKLLNLVED